MTQFFSIARDAFGNIVPGATVTIFEAGTETLAPIFADSGLSLAKLNPFTSESSGFFNFYSEPKNVKIQISKPGFPTVVLDDVPIPATTDQLMVGGMVEYSGPNFTILSNNIGQISYTDTVYNDGDMVTANAIVAPRPGMYFVEAKTAIDTSSTAAFANLTLDYGPTLAFATQAVNAGGVGDTAAYIAGLWRAAAGETMETFLFADGGDVVIDGGGSNPANNFMRAALLYEL